MVADPKSLLTLFISRQLTVPMGGACTSVDKGKCQTLGDKPTRLPHPWLEGKVSRVEPEGWRKRKKARAKSDDDMQSGAPAESDDSDDEMPLSAAKGESARSAEVHIYHYRRYGPHGRDGSKGWQKWRLVNNSDTSNWQLYKTREGVFNIDIHFFDIQNCQGSTTELQAASSVCCVGDRDPSKMYGVHWKVAALAVWLFVNQLIKAFVPPECSCADGPRCRAVPSMPFWTRLF